MFDAEEAVLERTETIIKAKNYHDNPEFLANEYAKLAEEYKKLFKQFGRILKISDRQQIELKQSRELICKCNIELTSEIQERCKAEQALKDANAKLHTLASIDGLTQLANRRHFDHYLKMQWAEMARNKNSLALILCDIDYFKKFNDTYGHQLGDECLKQVAQAITRAIRRPTDLAARYGGEEFAVILPNTNPEGAFNVAELIAMKIKELEITHCKSNIANVVSLSMGVSGKIPNRRYPPDVLISEADQALYRAKDQGRDRIVMFQPN